MAKLGPEYLNLDALKAAIDKSARIVSVDTILTNADGNVDVDATAAQVTISLPAAATYTGPEISVTKIDSSLNPVVVDCDAVGDKINDEDSVQINGQYDSLTFYNYKATNMWRIKALVS
ncbi:MAG: hypothetical protein NUV65_05955 [Candidatus Roizmanbacteria bacterium]|nr:hypothetical protein [Candidatus Roizmanbacteria bacterium]